MSDSEKRFFEGWDGPLLPFSAFFEHYTKGYTWVPHRDEHIIPRSLHTRIRITVERAEDWTMRDHGRCETLAEHGVYDAEEDAQETAKMLMNTFFMEFSEHEMRHLMTEMLKYCNGCEQYRREPNSGGQPLYELIDVDFNKFHPKAYETIIPSEPLPQSGGQHEDEGKEGA